VCHRGFMSRTTTTHRDASRRIATQFDRLAERRAALEREAEAAQSNIITPAKFSDRERPWRQQYL
jgi:hypothetical protein